MNIAFEYCYKSSQTQITYCVIYSSKCRLLSEFLLNITNYCLLIYTNLPKVSGQLQNLIFKSHYLSNQIKFQSLVAEIMRFKNQILELPGHFWQVGVH